MTDFDYDLFVIGAGSGGTRAARMSSSYGAKVAIAEEYRFGGTCVIRGCVPKKLFVYASHFRESFEDAKGFGWDTQEPVFNWPDLVSAKDEEIKRLEGIYSRNLENSGVELYKSRAEIVDEHHIKIINEGKIVSSKYILIATGATPFVPDIKGANYAITSNEAFHLDALPERITVVGGGYIAVEFAGIFNGLGVDTRLLYRGEQILRGFDDDIRQSLFSEMQKSGIDVRLNSDPGEITQVNEGYEVTLKDGSKYNTDSIMFATGRVPNTNKLGLENAGVTLGGKGEIIVDEYSHTSVESIYAVGDVTDRVNLTPVAIHEGAAFAETIFNNIPKPVDHSFIATAVFSQPEIGTVGLSEEQARAKYKDIKVYQSRFRPMKHTLSGRDTKMLMKLIIDVATDRVLGCHIIGESAAEIVQGIAISMRLGATKKDFDDTMALHPSAAEELVTMK